MTTVFLCGGKGKRLYPLTRDVPKPMVPIVGKPLVIRNMEKFIKCGQKNFIFCLGYLKKYFLDYFFKKINCVEYSDDYALFKGFWNKQLITVTCYLGKEDWQSADRLRQVSKKLTRLNGSIILCYGDLYFEDDIQEMLNDFEQSSLPMMMGVTHPQSQYGIVELSPYGNVIKFEEKPIVYTSWINAGLYFFDETYFFEMLKNPGESFENNILPKVIKNKKVFKLKKYWKSMENIKDMEEIIDQYKNGK